MNLGELQAELRHFAAERDWQALHTPKNLTTALAVEAATLAQIFQWRTPEDSRLAPADAAIRPRIGDGIADVLLRLLQVADHCQVDIPRAVRDKLARDALRHPAKRVVARAAPTRASAPGTHVLLDYENVQPGDAELRALVPDVGQVWVFHGPHQREVEKRFASFGTGATAVPISRPGKNALDFHLSFYMGYIASRNPEAPMVVLSNDKGYEPMLEHAKAMGFVVRRQSHGEATPPARKTVAKKVAADTSLETKAPVKRALPKAAPAKKAIAKKAAVKKAAARKCPAKSVEVAPSPVRKAATKAVPAKKAVAFKATVPAKRAAVTPPPVAEAPGASPPLAVGAGARTAAKPSVLVPGTAVTLRKLADSLRKMGDKRPTKPASLWRSLKSLLGAGATQDAVEAALARLIEDGVVRVDSVKGASYPRFDARAGAAAQD